MMVTAFRVRRSYRRYRDRAVAREIIQDLISHSRWIPTGYNRQFIDWVVLDDEKNIQTLLRNVLDEVKRDNEQGRDGSSYLGGLSNEEMDELIDLAINKKRMFFFNAPVVLGGYCEKNAVCAREEATYAAYNITLAAERMGLGTCHIGSIHLLLEEISHLQHELLGIPEDKELHVLLTLGYPVWRFRRMVPRRMPDILWNPVGS
jgi:nitroreductase